MLDLLRDLRVGLGDRVPEDLVGGASTRLGCAAVDPPVDQVCVDEGEVDRRVLEQLVEKRACFLLAREAGSELRLGLRQVGDVVDDRRRSS